MYIILQCDWHQLIILALTTLERSSRSLMLDQELLLIHQPGIASPPTLVVWQFPDGDNLPIGNTMGVRTPNTAAVGDEVFITGVTVIATALHRGPTHFSPDGEHCCVRVAEGPAQSRCVTFSEC